MIPDASKGANYLLSKPNIQSKDNKTIISQQAMIGKYQVFIYLNFERSLNASEISVAMTQNLEKVAQLVHSQPLQFSSPASTLSVTMYPDKNIEGKIEGAVNSILRSKKPLPPIPGLNTQNTPIQIPEILTRPVLSANETSKPEIGKEFIYDHVINKEGKEMNFREKVVRADTVPTLIKSLEAKKRALELKLDRMQKEPEGRGKTESRKAAVKGELDLVEKNLNNYRQHAQGATHGSTNMPRFAFNSLGVDGAKEKMAPILTNLRMHTLETEGKTVSAVSRSGAISDFRYGEVSLKELQDYKKLSDYKDLSAEEKKYFKEFYGLKDGHEAEQAQSLALLIKTKALVGYGADKLAKAEGNEFETAKSSDTQALLKKIGSSKTIEGRFEKLTPQEKDILNKITIDDHKLEEIVHDRKEFLTSLVLQDLQVHLETRKAGRGPLYYNRTAILDMTKDSKKEFGCVIHERTQGLDMKAIFDGLKDAKVLFDCKPGAAAYMDDLGQIHMPPGCAQSGVLECKLNPIFFNLSVQGDKGHLLNVDMQKKINDEALEFLKKEFAESEGIVAIDSALNSHLAKFEGNDPNMAVLSILSYLQKKDVYCGVNCFGGKDRTGYDLALNTHKKISDLAGLEVTSDQMRKVGMDLLDKNGVAAKVAKDNADHTTLKLSRYDLLLYDLKTTRGKMLRMAHGVNATFLALEPMIKSSLGFSGISKSSTPGQIYHVIPHKSLKSRMVKSFNEFKSSIEPLPF